MEANAVSLDRRVAEGFESLRDNQNEIKTSLRDAAEKLAETARKIDRWDNVLGGFLKMLAVIGAISAALGWVFHEVLHWGSGKN